MKIKEAKDRIYKWHEPFQDHEGGRDKILAGDADQELTGVVVTQCATYDVVKKAIELGANLIISHESIFFGGRIESDGLAENPVYVEKNRLIEDNGICIIRDHDRMHGNGQPFFPERKRNDYIFYGIMKELGWDDYVVGDTMKPLFYEIPETTGRELADMLMTKFNLNGVRVVGNLDTKVKTVWFCEHVNGDKKDGAAVDKAQTADCIIPFEICDYTLTQYVVDANATGIDKVLLEIGHFNTEEIGMRYCLEWLPEALGDDVPITYVQSGDLFTYISK